MESSSEFESMSSTEDSEVDSSDSSGSLSSSMSESEDMSIVLGIARSFFQRVNARLLSLINSVITYLVQSSREMRLCWICRRLCCWMLSNHISFLR